MSWLSQSRAAASLRPRTGPRLNCARGGPRAGARPSLGGSPGGLERLDVRGRRALGALLGVVAHLGALGQRLEAAALDRVVVHEQILAVVIRRDESVALVVAEPLHGSCGHLCPLRGMCTAKRGGC